MNLLMLKFSWWQCQQFIDTYNPTKKMTAKCVKCKQVTEEKMRLWGTSTKQFMTVVLVSLKPVSVLCLLFPLIDVCCGFFLTVLVNSLYGTFSGKILLTCCLSKETIIVFSTMYLYQKNSCLWWMWREYELSLVTQWVMYVCMYICMF